MDSDRDYRWDELRRLRKEGDWERALRECTDTHDPLLLWLQPSRDILGFIAQCARQLEVRRIVSVGCGSGLFEWLLSSATGLEVVGVEVNRGWWESKYAPPTFLPLLYADEDLTVTKKAAHADENNNTLDVDAVLQGDREVALMFCYFNDAGAFRDYVAQFRGRCLLVAGPGPSSPHHCQPEPFSTDLSPPWSLVEYKQVGHTQDFVAVYAR